MRNRYDLAAMASRKTNRRQIRLRKIDPTRAAEEAYRKALYQMLREAGKIVRDDILPAAAEARDSLKVKTTGRLGSAFDLLRDALTFRLTRSAEDMVQRVLDLETYRHTRAFTERVRATLGIDLSDVLSAEDLEDEMALALRRNVSLIRSLSEDVVKRVEGRVSEAVLSGKSSKALAKEMTDEFGVLQSRARLIARDQTAKWNGDLNRLRQTQAGIEKYRWRTSQDERVRPSHQAKEGETFSWDKPPADTGHPGQDYQCRCSAEAIIDLFEE